MHAKLKHILIIIGLLAILLILWLTAAISFVECIGKNCKTHVCASHESCEDVWCKTNNYLERDAHWSSLCLPQDDCITQARKIMRQKNIASNDFVFTYCHDMRQATCACDYD